MALEQYPCDRRGALLFGNADTATIGNTWIYPITQDIGFGSAIIFLGQCIMAKVSTAAIKREKAALIQGGQRFLLLAFIANIFRSRMCSGIGLERKAIHIIS